MPTPTPPLGLQQEQDYLLRVLRIRDGRFRTRIAEMYLGALQAMARSDSSERLSHAAHSMREVFDKLARQHEGEPIQLPKTWASDYIGSLGGVLDTARDQSACYDPLEEGWQGEIDPPVEKLLRVVAEAVAKHRSNPGNAEVERRFLRELEHPSKPLSSEEAALLLGHWRRYSKYFQDVAHHRVDPTPAEFEKVMNECTSFLLARLRYTAFTTLQVLDDLITEAEADA